MGIKTTIDYITIASTGDASDFGDLRTQTADGARECGSSSGETYGAYFGGYKGSNGGTTDEIEYITIASTGNTQNWGDLTTDAYTCGGASNSDRGLRFGASYSADNSRIDYFNWSTGGGNASDFGSLTSNVASISGNGCESSTRAVVAGGVNSGRLNTIQYITPANTGDATDFGDLIQPSSTQGATITGSGISWVTGCTNGTRGEFSGGVMSTSGYPGRLSINNIQYITIASTGNATDAGDLTDEIHFAQSGQG